MTESPFTHTKIFHHPERIKDLIEGKSCAPITMELDLTNTCNHACPNCSGGRQTKDHLTKDEAINYIEQMICLGTKGLIFTGGGEPLCHKDAAEIIRFAKSFGLDVGLITNGGMLANVDIDTLLKNCCWIRVSLDAGDPQNYLRIHGREQKEFFKVLENIRLLGDRKAQLKAKCTVGVGYLLDIENSESLPNITKQISEWNIDYLQIRPFHWSNYLNIQTPLALAKKYETETFKVVTSAQKYQNKNVPRNYDYCYGAEVCGVIQADSGLALCCHLRGQPEFIIGYLRENSLEELWYGPRKREILANLDVHQCVPLCRCDAMNRVLVDVCRPVMHKNFL